MFRRSTKVEGNLEEGSEGTEVNFAGDVSDSKTILAGDKESTLHRDVFTLFFVSKIVSPSFFYALFFFLFQMAILYLIGWNLLKDAPEGNPLKVPIRTSTEVTIAQSLALFVSFITQQDVITTIDMLRLGYDHDVKEVFKAATRTKWIMANICRFVEGLVTIGISFIFIIQSTDVLELFLNFAAVQFVSELDDVGFEIAHRGYISGGLERMTKKVIGIKFQLKSKRDLSVNGTDKKEVKSKYVQRFIFSVVMLALYGSWAFIRYMQETGHYQNLECNSFNVRFGDQYFDFFQAQSCNTEISDGCPWKNRTRPFHYGPFSDSYEASRDNYTGTLELENKRPVYYQRGRKEGFGEGSPPGKISYSTEERAWIFTVDGVTKGPMDDSGWLLRSPPTIDSYSLLEAPSSEWSIWTNFLVKASPFDFTCGECNADVDCNYHGKCVQKQCLCDESWVGKKCQTCAACSELSEISNDNGGGNYYLGGEEQEPLNFFRLEGVEVYERPVYYKPGTSLKSNPSLNPNQIDSEFDTYPNGTIELMFYAGTRFYITVWLEFMADPSIGMQAEDIERLRDTFVDFHSTWHLDDNKNRSIAFYTPVVDNPMPIEVQWNQYKEASLAMYSGNPSTGFEVAKSLSFDCAIENEKNKCAFPVTSRSY
mmetsp:Transcript_24838/g.37515  ORF Transcript_24838/g.37515 Transcript_24838/m.37515 type:complete len:651 (-) Transcript_24838:86-2038(-)